MELFSPKFVVVPTALADIYRVATKFLPPFEEKKEEFPKLPTNGKKKDIKDGNGERKHLNVAPANGDGMKSLQHGDKPTQLFHQKEEVSNVMKILISIRNNFQIYFLKSFGKVFPLIIVGLPFPFFLKSLI